MPPKQSRKRRKPAASQQQQKKACFTLSKDQHDAVKEAFDAYADCGQLSIKRAKHALREALHMTIPKDEIRTYADGPTVGAAGGNGSQEEETIPPTLDWTTFVRLATSKQRQQEKANHAFSLMDTTDKKGFLSIHDVARVAKELGEEFTEEEMEEMMTEADPSGDGLVVDADALFRIVREVNL